MNPRSENLDGITSVNANGNSSSALCVAAVCNMAGVADTMAIKPIKNIRANPFCKKELKFVMLAYTLSHVLFF